MDLREIKKFCKTKSQRLAFNELVKSFADQEPDVVVVTKDLLDEMAKLKDPEEIYQKYKTDNPKGVHYIANKKLEGKDYYQSIWIGTVYRDNTPVILESAYPLMGYGRQVLKEKGKWKADGQRLGSIRQFPKFWLSMIETLRQYL